MLRALILLLLTVPVAGIAAPVPRGFKKPVLLYFPTTVGTKWVYDCDGKEQVEEVSDVIEKDGIFVVSFGDVIGERLILDRDYHVSKQGLFYTRNIFGEKECTEALLKLPAKPGDEWVYVLGGDEVVVSTIGAIEDVEVPAGKFRAVRVDSTHSLGNVAGFVQQSIIWYAPNVGRVKEVNRFGAKEKTTVLKSFTPGK